MILKVTDIGQFLNQEEEEQEEREKLVNLLTRLNKDSKNEVFNKIAIESLGVTVKQIWFLKQLYTDVKYQGRIQDKCVLVNQSFIRSELTDEFKCKPHYLFARIWRWPGLKKSELRSHESCGYHLSRCKTVFCINPYHYDRRLLSSSEDEVIEDRKLEERQRENKSRQKKDPGREKKPKRGKVVKNEKDLQREPQEKVPELEKDPRKENDLRQGNVPRRGKYPRLENDRREENVPPKKKILELEKGPRKEKVPPQEKVPELGKGPRKENDLRQGNVPQRGKDPRLENIPRGKKDPRRQNVTQHEKGPRQKMETEIKQEKLHKPKDKSQSTDIYNSNGGSANNSKSGKSSRQSRSTDIPTYLYNPLNSKEKSKKSLKTADSNKTTTDTTDTLQHPGSIIDDEDYIYQLMGNRDAFNHWCSISYYEFDTQIDDGHMFCLGNLTKNPQIQKKIGSGIFLYLCLNGDILLRRTCDSPIFVQSKYRDIEEKQENANLVHDIDLWTYIKVFSLREYYERIKKEIAAKTKEGKTISSSDFKEFYCIRLSFADEWGPKTTRKTIEETSCWIDIMIRPALIVLNQLLDT
ncbi:mothers against decapentaplegic homolog 4-like [Microplitis mediator]|uniref:mothers against decapentaplegic homolog 4-like n=1 Tax=Microplitis mediator TaxID=375433 RepID=UPI0025557255|nr:mothers against decapentaplegic homolog 4-like [Microplitis mediator]